MKTAAHAGADMQNASAEMRRWKGVLAFCAGKCRQVMKEECGLQTVQIRLISSLKIKIVRI